MSRRRRAAEPAPEEEQEEERDPEGLKFNEPLSWRAGRAIPTAELVKRLDKLSKELTELDQDWEHKESLNKIAEELSSTHILGHKDKGVKAFAACCLVDILKICAPDAPFTPKQLKVSLWSLWLSDFLYGDVSLCFGMRADHVRAPGYLRLVHNLHSARPARSILDME